MGKKVRTQCVDTGVWFASLSDAAKFIGCDAFTVAKKIQAFGYFVDNQGRKWVRETPMISKNVYQEKYNYVKRKIRPGLLRNKKKTSVFDKVFAFARGQKTPANEDKAVLPVQMPEPLQEAPKPEVKQPKQSVAFCDLPPVVQNFIQDKIREMIINEKPWSEIKRFMIDTGCKKITLRVEDEIQ